jgi:hypothetical protein
MIFSLCIPTMDRFDFLKKNLPHYINNNFINEIIITDENGNDIEQIKQHFDSSIDSSKLKLFKNDTRLGCLLNKHKACSLASNEWIAIIDSDNFADKHYFESASSFLYNNNIPKNSILAPERALPSYKFDVGLYKKNIINHNLSLMLNTGNYIINKYLIDNVNFENDMDDIPYSNACDVVFFNIMLFEQFNLNFYVIKNMYYNHATHKNSIYLKEHKTEHYKKLIYKIRNERLFNLSNRN